MTEKEFSEDLILTENTKFDCSIKVNGNITCKNGIWNLIVAGNIDAGNIDAMDINARDINARDINAGDINAGNINAWDIGARDIDAGNIDAMDINARDINARDIVAWDIVARDIVAWNIICISRKKKNKDAKTIAYSIILDRFNRERKEVMPEALKKKART